MNGKYFIALIFICIAIISCHSVATIQPVGIEKDTIISKDKVEAVFNSRDTMYATESIACTGSFYAIINKDMVVMLQDTMPVVYDSSIYIKIDSSNSSQLANLYLYENGHANLNNFCTDAPYPPDTSSGILTKAYGDIVIKFWSEPSGNANGPVVSIYIDHLHFIDSVNSRIISIQNKLIWKVQNMRDYGG
jgi:hypothetical protein